MPRFGQYLIRALVRISIDLFRFYDKLTFILFDVWCTSRVFNYLLVRRQFEISEMFRYY